MAQGRSRFVQDPVAPKPASISACLPFRCLRVGRSGDLCKLCENCTNLPCCRSRGPHGSHTRDLLLTIQGILGIKWLALRGSHSEQLNARRRTYLERDGRSGIGRLPHSCRRPTYCSRVTFQLPCCYISAPFPAAETKGPITRCKTTYFMLRNGQVANRKCLAQP